MSALRDYRNLIASSTYGGRLHVDPRQAIDAADAAIVEMEAELATEREHPSNLLQCASCQRLAVVQNAQLVERAEQAGAGILARVSDGFGTLAARCAELEAENERLKVCGSCHWMHCDFDDCTDDVDHELPGGCSPDDHCHFNPSRWTSREP